MWTFPDSWQVTAAVLDQEDECEDEDTPLWERSGLVDLTAPKRLYRHFNYVIYKNVDASVENIEEEHAELCELEVMQFNSPAALTVQLVCCSHFLL